jgi:hypothetical protein
MTMISGKDGHVLVDASPLAAVTRWSFETLSAGVSFASSATGGYRRRTRGAKQGRGKIEFLAERDNPWIEALSAGARVTLRLAIDPSGYFVAPVVLEEVRIETNVDSGAAVAGAASFVTDGAWSEPDFTA